MSVISMKLKELEMQLDMMVMMSLWLTVRIALYENYTSTEEFLIKLYQFSTEMP